MSKPFRALRAEMVRAGVDQAYACKQRGCGQTYMTERFTGRRPWTMDDAYWWLEFLDLPREDIYKYFPPQGRAEEHDKLKKRVIS